jgi:hypothetical protein
MVVVDGVWVVGGGVALVLAVVVGTVGTVETVELVDSVDAVGALVDVVAAVVGAGPVVGVAAASPEQAERIRPAVTSRAGSRRVAGRASIPRMLPTVVER